MGSGHIHHMPEGSITVLPRWRDWRSTQQSCVIWKAENQGRFCEQFLDQYVQYKVKRSLVSTESLLRRNKSGLGEALKQTCLYPSACSSRETLLWFKFVDSVCILI